MIFPPPGYETSKKDHANSPKMRASIRRNLAVMTGFARSVRAGHWKPTVYRGDSSRFPFLFADTRFYKSHDYIYQGEQPTTWERMGHHTKIPLLCYGLLTLPNECPWFLFSTHLNDDTVNAIKEASSPVSTLAKSLKNSFARYDIDIDYVLRLEASSQFGRVHVHGFLRGLDGKSKKDRDFIKDRLNVAMGKWQTPSSAIYQSHVPQPVLSGKWARYIMKDPAISRLQLRRRGIFASKLYAASNDVRSHSHALWDEMHDFAKDDLMRRGV